MYSVNTSYIHDPIIGTVRNPCIGHSIPIGISVLAIVNLTTAFPRSQHADAQLEITRLFFLGKGLDEKENPSPDGHVDLYQIGITLRYLLYKKNRRRKQYIHKRVDKVPKKPNSDWDFRIIIGMIIMVLIPVYLTIQSIQVPEGNVFHLSTGVKSHSIVVKATHKQLRKSSLDYSPYGYTWSLSLFIAPIIVIWTWLHVKFKDKLFKKTFWLTFGILTPIGFLLDIIFGDLFFIFPNKGAYLGIYLPGYDFGKG